MQCSGGRCDNGQACNPVGNICGAPVLPDGGKINASQDCCDGMKTVCKTDVSGIPRCFGGGSQTCPNGYTGVAPCCIDPGALCQLSDQCCDGAKCVAGSDGGVQCVVPTCLPIGSSCTPGQCCAPSACNDGVCRTGTPDSGIIESGGDGGSSSDAGLCSATGVSCTTSSQCCSMTCALGHCGAARLCEPAGGLCTTTADCCSGTSCLSGICGQASCAGVGQTCSAGTACCSGLGCVDQATGGACGTTGSCVCTGIIQ